MSASQPLAGAQACEVPATRSASADDGRAIGEVKPITEQSDERPLRGVSACDIAGIQVATKGTEL